MNFVIVAVVVSLGGFVMAFSLWKSRRPPIEPPASERVREICTKILKDYYYCQEDFVLPSSDEFLGCPFEKWDGVSWDMKFFSDKGKIKMTLYLRSDEDTPEGEERVNQVKRYLRWKIKAYKADLEISEVSFVVTANGVSIQSDLRC